MFTLGIPKNDYRRATRVLDYERQPSIPYNAELQDDGFYNFSFPGMDEYDFEKISIKLKGEGVRIVGADEALTEKQIMKLANLIKEDSPEENDFIDDIKMALEKNRQLFNNPMFKTISDIIKNYEMGGDEDRMMGMPSLTEQKLRKLIRDEFKKIS